MLTPQVSRASLRLQSKADALGKYPDSPHSKRDLQVGNFSRRKYVAYRPEIGEILPNLLYSDAFAFCDHAALQ